MIPIFPPVQQEVLGNFRSGTASSRMRHAAGTFASTGLVACYGLMIILLCDGIATHFSPHRSTYIGLFKFYLLSNLRIVTAVSFSEIGILLQ